MTSRRLFTALSLGLALSLSACAAHRMKQEGRLASTEAPAAKDAVQAPAKDTAKDEPKLTKADKKAARKANKQAKAEARKNAKLDRKQSGQTRQKARVQEREVREQARKEGAQKPEAKPEKAEPPVAAAPAVAAVAEAATPPPAEPAPPAPAKAPDLPKATFIKDVTVDLDTSHDPDNILVLDLSDGGRVLIRLMSAWAPHHVERVKELVKQGFYNGIIFHRVIDGFMAQGGDPTGTGEGGSKLPDLKAEFNTVPHMRGTVSMARTGDPDSANSQFFIMFFPRFALDRKYTNFGRVIAGMEWVDKIERGEPPEHPTKILQASMLSEHKAPPVIEPEKPAAPVALPNIAIPPAAQPAPQQPQKQ